MVKPLVIKPGKKSSQWEFVVVVIVFLVPVGALQHLWRRDIPIHSENPSLNLLFHAAIIVFPLLAAGLISLLPTQIIAGDDEAFLSASNLLEKLAHAWSMMFPLWATPLVAAVALVHRPLTDGHVDLSQLSTSPKQALWIAVVTFVVGLFYITLFFKRTLSFISAEGVRIGLIRFFGWSQIHHVSRLGSIYVLYHQAKPDLPAAVLKVKDPERRKALDQYLSEKNIPISDVTDAAFGRFKAGVVSAFLLNLIGSITLLFYTEVPGIWVVIISLGLGMTLTLLADRIRGVSEWGKHKPIIENDNPPTTNLDAAQ